MGTFLDHTAYGKVEYYLTCYTCGAKGPRAKTRKEAAQGYYVTSETKKSESLYNEMCCGDTPWED